MCQYNIIKTFVFGPSYFSSGARILKKFIRLVKLISMKCSQNIAKKSLNDADSQFDDCQSHLYQNLKIVKGVKSCQVSGSELNSRQYSTEEESKNNHVIVPNTYSFVIKSSLSIEISTPESLLIDLTDKKWDYNWLGTSKRLLPKRRVLSRF